MTSAILSRTDGKILAVDTSAASGSLAIGSFQPNASPKILIERRWNKRAMHSEVATMEVAAALGEAGLSLGQLSGFAVNVGPGSFTGLRVGINLIRTLAYSLRKPVATFTSLEMIAYQNSSEGEKTLVAIKAIQNFHYAGAYQKTGQGMRTLVEPSSATLEEIRALGTFDRTFVEGYGAFETETSARTLVEMSMNAPFSSWNCVKPLYVRASEAEEKLKKGLLKPLP